ncbi:MAG: helix-turn-helix domain-containing protein [Candidatus Woesearchaeota archaeon]|jgi:sugar-specific transcriptional regulator TrmB
MSIESTLEEIGLTKNEIKIYLALLELGLTSTGKIIKKTGIHTSKVYDGLERLADKGLVSHIIIANIKHFNAVDPERILNFLYDKKKNIENQEKTVEEILPALKLKRQLVGDDTEAEIFQGWKGMETVYQLMLKVLKKGDVNYVFGASKGEDEEGVRIFFNKHALRLAKKGIKQRIIFNESARGNIQETIQHSTLNQIRHMQYTTPAEINLWADKTMIVILRKKPTVILISDAKVTDSFKKYFEFMWIMAKE